MTVPCKGAITYQACRSLLRVRRPVFADIMCRASIEAGLRMRACRDAVMSHALTFLNIEYQLHMHT